VAWNISPLDGQELPNISMLDLVLHTGKDKTLAMDEDEFWECIQYFSIKNAGPDKNRSKNCIRRLDSQK